MFLPVSGAPVLLRHEVLAPLSAPRIFSFDESCHGVGQLEKIH